MAHDIELTDHIKDYIMTNRVYHIPKPVDENKIMNQTINNYNTMNTYINNIEPLKKLQDYLEYNNINLMPFERSVELKYEKTKRRLEKDQGHHEITEDDMLDILDQMTKIKGDQLDQFNIIFDSDMNKLFLYGSGDWSETFLVRGIKKIIGMLQDYYLNAYECYMIRKIQKQDNVRTRQQLRDLLQEYYAFLASMDIDPFIKGQCDNKIMFNAEDDEYWDIPDPKHDLVEEYMKLYTKTKQNMMFKKRDSVKNSLIDIVKRNNNKNMNDLNKHVIALIKIDPEYKHKLSLKQSNERVMAQ